MKQCVHCGREIEASLRYCPTCGGMQPEPAQQQPPYPPQPQYQQGQQPPYQPPVYDQPYGQQYPGNGQYGDAQGYYNQPMYQQPYYPPVVQTNNKATASMVLGILGMVGTVLPIIPCSFFILPLVALILGAVARKECPEGHPKRGQATAGLALGLIKLLLSLLFVVILLLSFNTLAAALGDYPFMREFFDALEEIFGSAF